jgi:preprotein translocase SecE subunit
MAVAVKNTPEVASASLLDRMAVASLAGTAYALGTLGIVFYLLPSLWDALGWGGPAAVTLRGLLQLAALGGLIVFGTRLLAGAGSKAAPGLRAGIFVGLVGFLLVLLLTRWASLWIEHWSFDRGFFGPTVGAVLTAVIGLGLVALGIRLFLRPASERFLVHLEEQGWFTPRPYKALQGLRVRRGTIFGILLIVGAGIWTMLAHNTLRKGAPDWQLNIPFTGGVIVESTGDVSEKDLSNIPDWKSRLEAGSLVVDRYTLQEINQSIDPATHVKIVEPGSSDYATNQVVLRSEPRLGEPAYNDVVRKLKAEGGVEPKTTSPEPARGPTIYRSLTLLPSVQFTIPLLLLAAALWLAWRIVNVPAFADFLIATEAEMNKVSWTTQRRLVQDTIVVLVTVVLMAFFLAFCDLSWKSVLSWKPIGVLQIPEEQPETTTDVENRPW